MPDIDSLFVGTKAAGTIYYAQVQAERVGLPLNRVVTINYACCPCIAPGDVPRAFARLRNHHFAPFCRRPGRGRDRALACAPTYAFAFENERNGVPFVTMEPGGPHNVHVHWHVHVHPARFHEFECSVWQWLKQTAGACTDNAIKITGPQSVGYLNKGARERDARLYARGHDARPQGIIRGGRRSGTTVNIGPSARRAMDRQLNIRRQLPVINGRAFFKTAAAREPALLRPPARSPYIAEMQAAPKTDTTQRVAGQLSTLFSRAMARNRTEQSYARAFGLRAERFAYLVELADTSPRDVTSAALLRAWLGSEYTDTRLLLIAGLTRLANNTKAPKDERQLAMRVAGFLEWHETMDPPRAPCWSSFADDEIAF